MPRDHHLNLGNGAKWTTVAPTCGWIHFRIIRRFWLSDELMLELAAACDVRATFTIAAKELKDRSRFRVGWIDPAEIKAETLDPK